MPVNLQVCISCRYYLKRTTINGPLEKPGGSFKIDHPLDPANKYLYHSFVESPDMKNIYDGVLVLDPNGEAEIDLPDWFGALNKDFRSAYCYRSSWAESLYCRGNFRHFYRPQKQ